MITESKFRELRDGFPVIIGAFMLCFIVDGITYSFGILMLELLAEFNDSRGKTALVGSLLTGTHVLGPLFGFLCERFGMLPVVMLGSLLSCAGFVGSSFSTSLLQLYVLYGIVAGIGLAMMILVANVCIIKTFRKNESLAAGIAVCGSGIGTFVISQLMQILIDSYGWRGALFVQGGITLHGVICGLLVGGYLSNLSNKAWGQDIEIAHITEGQIMTDVAEKMDTGSDQKDTNEQDQDVTKGVDQQKSYTHGIGRMCEVNGIDRLTNEACDLKSPIASNRMRKNSIFQTAASGVLVDANQNGVPDGKENLKNNEDCEKYRTNDNNEYDISAVTKSDIFIINEPLNRRRMSIKEQRRSEDLNKGSNGIAFVEMSMVASMSDAEQQPAKSWTHILNLDLLSNLKLIVVLASTGAFSLSVWVPFHLLPDQVNEIDNSRKIATWIVSSIGIGNTIGRVLFGCLGDIRRIRRSVLLTGILFALGLSTGSSPFLTSAETKLFYGCSFGLLIGGFFALLPLVLSELFGAEAIARTFGMTMFTIGLSSSVATTIGGYIRDTTGSYTASFLVSGGEFLLAAGGFALASCLKGPPQKQS